MTSPKRQETATTAAATVATGGGPRGRRHLRRPCALGLVGLLGLAAVACSLLLLARATPAASTALELMIHRRRECPRSILSASEFHAAAAGDLEALAAQGPAGAATRWRRHSHCRPSRASTPNSDGADGPDLLCFDPDRATIASGRLTLTATAGESSAGPQSPVRAAAGARVEQRPAPEPAERATHLRMRVKFPESSAPSLAHIATTIGPLGLNLTLSLPLPATPTESNPDDHHGPQEIHVRSSTHHVNATALAPCPERFRSRVHHVELAWDAQWLWVLWNGHLLLEDLPIAPLPPSASAAAATSASASVGWSMGVGVDFEILVTAPDAQAGTASMQIKQVELSVDSADPGAASTTAKDPTCRPLRHPDANCRSPTTPFTPRLGADNGFLSLEEVYAFIHVDAPKLFPAGFVRVEEIGRSVNNRSLLALCVGACERNTTAAIPQVLFTGMHHSREPVSMMNLLYTIDLLAADLRNGVLDTLTLLYARQLWFVLVVNPDGYARNEALEIWKRGEAGKRKNGRDTCPGGNVDDGGVDLNRNYDVCFAQDLFGSSPRPCDEDYRGPGPFSEPETLAIKDFVERPGADIAVSLNYHSFGRFFNVPFACEALGAPAAPDLAIYESWAREMTRFNGFAYGQPWSDPNLYSVNGETSDWLWNAHGIFAMSPEVGPSFSAATEAGFWPTRDEIPTLALELHYSNLVSIRLAGPSYDLRVLQMMTTTTDDVDTAAGPLALTLELANRGLRVIGDVEVVVAESLTGNGLATSTQITGEALGTLRDGQRRVQRTIPVPRPRSTDALHVLLRDALSCQYIRLALRPSTTATTTTNGTIAFQQWQTLDLPPCGVCRTLGRTPDELPPLDPRCAHVDDLVQPANLVSRARASGQLTETSSLSPAPSEVRATDPPTSETVDEATPASSESSSTSTMPVPPSPTNTTTAPTPPPVLTSPEPVVSESPTPTPSSPPLTTTPAPPSSMTETPTPTSSSPPSASPTSTSPPLTPTPSSSPASGIGVDGPKGTSQAAKTTTGDAAVGWRASLTSTPVLLAGFVMLAVLVLAIVVRRRSVTRDGGGHRRSKYAKVVNDEDREDDDDDDNDRATKNKKTTKHSGRRNIDDDDGDSDNEDEDDDDAEFGRRRNPNSRQQRGLSDDEVV